MAKIAKTAATALLASAASGAVDVDVDTLAALLAQRQREASAAKLAQQEAVNASKKLLKALEAQHAGVEAARAFVPDGVDTTPFDAASAALAGKIDTLRQHVAAPAASGAGKSADSEKRQTKAETPVPDEYSDTSKRARAYRNGYAGKAQKTPFQKFDAGTNGQAYLAGMLAGKHNPDRVEALCRAAGIGLEAYNALAKVM